MYATREEWLTAAVAELRGLFTENDVTLPDKIRVSCGWSKRASKDASAWCWPSKASSDGTTEILVSPEHDDSKIVLDYLVHELSHAHDDCESGHSGEFRRVALLVGLTGPMKSTTAGPELSNRLAKISESLGRYPHSAINPGVQGKLKQSTRMIKLQCPDCNYTVRTTKKWIDQGMPTCPCETPMELAL